MTRKRVGVLISGRGSNLQALIEACRAPDLSRQDRARDLERAWRARTCCAPRQACIPTLDHQPQGLRIPRGLRRRPRRGAEARPASSFSATRASCGCTPKASCAAGGTATSTSTRPSCPRSKVCTRTLAFWMKASRSAAAPCISCGRRWTQGPSWRRPPSRCSRATRPTASPPACSQAEHRLYPHALGLVASGAVRVEGEHVVGTTQVRAPGPAVFAAPRRSALIEIVNGRKIGSWTGRHVAPQDVRRADDGQCRRPDARDWPNSKQSCAFSPSR